MPNRPVVVFVDIDVFPGSALPPPMPPATLATLASDRIILVLCSRRTRAELECRRQALGLFHPFICEDGAAAFVPERYFGRPIEGARKVCGYEVVEFSAPYDQVVEKLRRVSDRLRISVVGFHDMSVAQVAEECGLSLLDARLAKLREYEEWVRLACADPAAARRLLMGLAAAGVHHRPAGEFWRLSTGGGFGSPVAVLARLYRLSFGCVKTIGVGTDPAAADGIAPHVDAWLPAPFPMHESTAPWTTEWLDELHGHIDVIREGQLSLPVPHAR